MNLVIIVFFYVNFDQIHVFYTFLQSFCVIFFNYRNKFF